VESCSEKKEENLRSTGGNFFYCKEKTLTLQRERGKHFRTIEKSLSPLAPSRKLFKKREDDAWGKVSLL